MVLLLPLLFGIVSFIMNKSQEERPLKWRMTKHQIFNTEVLTNYLKNNPSLLDGKTKEEIKKEICSHGWDIAVVEVVLDEICK